MGESEGRAQTRASYDTVAADYARLLPAMNAETAASLGGMIAWYSLIHTPPEGLATIFSEFARVLAPDGWLLIAFQSEAGQRVDRATAYGRPVAMTSYLHDPEHVTSSLESRGFSVQARLLRAAEGVERGSQCVVLLRRGEAGRAQLQTA